MHLALDPEFAWGADKRPVASIGALDAPAINRAQQLIGRRLVERDLPPRILVVHQFRDDMVRRKAGISACTSRWMW
ncbi:MAG: hypothetical protein U0531_14415 [Dehalococcoidia bacterium]